MSAGDDTVREEPGPAVRVRIGVLGPLEVQVGDELVSPGGPARRAVLAALALAGGRSVSTDELAEVLWGDDAVSRDRGTLQVHVHNLRQRLGPRGRAILVTKDNGYALDTGEVEIDAAEWATIVEAARGSMARGEHELAAAHAKRALALVRGEVLAGIDSPVLDVHRRTWEEDVLVVREEWIDAELAAGRHGTVLGTLRELVEEHPLREHFWAQLMLALYRSGRQAEALEAFQQARTVLIDELGLDPGPALKHLEESILAQSAGLELGRSSAAVHWLDSSGVPQRCPLVAGQALAIGRGTDCQVNLDFDRLVSRRHACLNWDDDRWRVEDLGSVNGTVLNGRPIDGSADVADGDVVRCGETILVVVTVDGDRSAAARSRNVLRNTLRRSQSP